MHCLTLCTLVIFMIIATISYANGATCKCTCCSGIGCTATSAGEFTVSSCSACTNSQCQSSYSSTCVTSNGVTSSSCVDSGANILFEPMYRTILTTAMFIQLLMYQKFTM